MAVRMTRHARQRMGERIHIPPRDAEKNAAAALRYGLRHKETRGDLHYYIKQLFRRHRNANNVRIYRMAVYIFHNQTLVTVFPLPERFRDYVEQLWRERRGNERPCIHRR